MSEDNTGYEVKPTGNPVSEQYSDIAYTSLFREHAAQISSERAVIWQRYSVMLLANSAILAFMAGDVLVGGEKIIGITFGLALCIAWWIITRSGFRLFIMRREIALEFTWTLFDKKINPFVVSEKYEEGIKGGTIYVISLLVIMWFFSFHSYLLVRELFF